MTRLQLATAAREQLSAAITDLHLLLDGRFMVTPRTFREREAAIRTRISDAARELWDLAQMSDEEFETDRVDGAPDHQWQVTTPAEVWAS